MQWPLEEYEKEGQEEGGPGKSGSLSLERSQGLKRFARSIGQVGAAAQQGGVHVSPVCLSQDTGFPQGISSYIKFDADPHM